MSPRAVAILLLAGSLFPAGAQSWETLRGLQPNDRIRVQDASGERRQGSFQSLSADAISLRTKSGDVSIERARVRKVEVRASSRRVRNILIGAGVGFAIGLVTDQTLGTYLRNEAAESTGARVITYLVPIGLFGAIGASVAPYRTLYRAR